MTWIAACSGQRGIYQETIMTDEERRRLIARFKSHEVVMWTDIDLAADEIERLAKELANANRLLEINRRRSLEKSGGLEIKQSDAEPPPKHPIGFDDKPMTDWYYDDDGVCRPSRTADRSGK